MIVQTFAETVDASLASTLRFGFIHLKDEAKFGDVSHKMYRLLCQAEEMMIIDDLWITSEELIEILFKGLRRSEMRARHQGLNMLADNFALKQIELDRRVQTFLLSRSIKPADLKQILSKIQ